MPVVAEFETRHPERDLSKKEGLSPKKKDDFQGLQEQLRFVTLHDINSLNEAITAMEAAKKSDWFDEYFWLEQRDEFKKILQIFKNTKAKIEGGETFSKGETEKMTAELLLRRHLLFAEITLENGQLLGVDQSRMEQLLEQAEKMELPDLSHFADKWQQLQERAASDERAAEAILQ